jgi:hypothetical protein
MKAGIPGALLLALAATGPAWGQFELFAVSNGSEQAVARTYDFGAVEPAGSLAVLFRIRNISSAEATLDLLTVNGSGFSMAGANQPAIPVSLAPGQSVDFTVAFQSAGTGMYSAALDSVGISAILTAGVPVELTCQLLTAGGAQWLGAAPVDYGSVTRGTAATRRVVLLNQTSVALIAPGPLLTGSGYSLSGPSPGGTLVEPAASVTFDLQFSPTTDGAATGTLAIGDRRYALTGIGVDPPLPQPRLTVALAQPDSAQQGTVAVNLSAAAQTSGTGTVTIAFLPAAAISVSTADPAIAFASGGQSAAFTVAPGDTQGHFGTGLTLPFQTGTTAGTLTIAVQLGTNSDRQTVTILPAVVGVTAAQGVRSAGTVEVDVTGYDNTRSAGALSFTFFDAAGNALGPAIQADGSAGFTSYFRNAAGGTFDLKAVFPVTGDTSLIRAFQAVVTNSAGASTATRTSF